MVHEIGKVFFAKQRELVEDYRCINVRTIVKEVANLGPPLSQLSGRTTSKRVRFKSSIAFKGI
ncbi:hypothetical protein [Sulfitobacter pacificus]|uniref:Uncharacterized protein n=1 Tax=Sulfitobacter pacificus TaxID=1499314 RepID=A0ABQ5VPY5_9RHOB|nr:hypothetical protein [Sulfitobacter pacificus]GLQ29286.1 hypothetical protein GCM10007927_40900 [Sulfitobacter pacificus]